MTRNIAQFPAGGKKNAHGFFLYIYIVRRGPDASSELNSSKKNSVIRLRPADKPIQNNNKAVFTTTTCDVTSGGRGKKGR